MTGAHPSESRSRRSGFQFAELLKVQGKLALREPYALLGGRALPAVLLAVFGSSERRIQETLATPA